MPQIIRLQGGQPPAPPTGLGDGIAKLGDALFGGNPAQQELLRQKAIEAQRLNDGNLAFQGGLRDANTSPEDMAARAAAAGVSGKGLGEYQRGIAAMKYGAEDPRTSGAQIAAGQGLGDTFVGVKMSDATTRRGQDVAAATSRANSAAQVGQQRYEFDNAPVNTLDDRGQSTITRRSESYGRAAPEQLGVVQGNAARNALTAGGGQIPESTNAPTQRFIGAAPNAGQAPKILQLQTERDRLPAGDPRRGELDAAIRAEGVSAGGQTAYDRTVDEDYAKTDIGLQKDAAASTQRTALLGHLGDLLRSGRATTGGASQWILAGKQLAAQLGVPIDNVAETEVFRAIANRLTLDSAGGSLGAQISNSDRQFLVDAGPSLGNTPAGNLQVIDMLTRLEQRKRDVAQWAAEYKASRPGGRLDAGWSAFAQQKAEANPLFARPSAPATAGAPPAQPAQGAPTRGDVQDGFQFLGGDPSNSANWRKVQ